MVQITSTSATEFSKTVPVTLPQCQTAVNQTDIK